MDLVGRARDEKKKQGSEEKGILTVTVAAHETYPSRFAMQCH